MTKESGLSTTKPTSIFVKPLTLNFKDFSAALAKAGVDFVFGKWDSLAGDGVDALKAVGLQADAGAIAWLLVHRSLLEAMKKLVEERAGLDAAKFDPKVLQVAINQALESSSLTINQDFFTHPGENPIFGLIKPTFATWLRDSGLNDVEAKAISNRLPSYFAKALHKEWGSHPKDYATLKETLETPFIEADEQAHAWLRYASWLQQQIDEPMFGEAFSLKQIFVPLRGYYDRKQSKQTGDDSEEGIRRNKQTEKVVVDLEFELENWLNSAKKDDAIRLVSGSPGCGKSSLTKMWAAKLAEKGDISVLFIPLHLLEMKSDLVEAVGAFFKFNKDQDNSLPYNPLDADHRHGRLLVIFDGLDELAMQGKIAEKTAQDFVTEVRLKVERFNQLETYVQVLISGRELVVQANENHFREEGQVLHVLPYFVSEDDHEDYVDSQKLLGQDQRDIWWQNYGRASGKGYAGLPEELNKKNLTEITAQPLLNYLVALSLHRGKLNFSQETNLNAVYADLLKSIYERGWAGGKQHAAIRGIEEEEFAGILEEIALAAWHGNGRTTTVKDIESHCNNSGLGSLLTRFQEGLQKDSKTTCVTNLLTAFYFRQSGNDNSGERTFEFTHKSFGEYLTARRIVREIELIQENIEARKAKWNKGWDERESLKHWAMLCGSSPMDQYLFNFIQDEVRLYYLQNPSKVDKWQQTFCHLIWFMMENGMPMELLKIDNSFQEWNRQAINSEDSLLAVLGTFAGLTKKISKINFPSPEAFGALIARLQGQRTGVSNPMSFHCLSYLNLSRCILHGRDFYDVNFKGANLEGAHFVTANFRRANLEGVNLAGANLAGANLERVNLRGAHLAGAHLAGANLERAHLRGANLEGAHLAGANLERAHLEGAHLEGANLERAHLEGAHLEGANLQGADIRGTILKGAVSL